MWTSWLPGDARPRVRRQCGAPSTDPRLSPGPLFTAGSARLPARGYAASWTYLRGFSPAVTLGKRQEEGNPICFGVRQGKRSSGSEGL